MTDPRHAHATDHGRYYRHPVTGAMLISVTNVLDQKSKPALVPWATKLTAAAAWNAVPRMVTALRRRDDCRPPTAKARTQTGWEPCRTCYGCVTREIRDAADVVRERASDRGTRVHAAAEAHLLHGKDAPPPDEDVAPYVGQYERFLREWDVDVERDVLHTELTVASPTLGLAGTLDLTLMLPLQPAVDGGKGKPARTPDGKKYPWTVDIKTSETKPADVYYAEHSLQLAALRHCDEAWLPDDTIAKNPRTVGGAILNLRRDDYALLPVPCGMPEWDAYRGLLALAKWDHARKADPVPVSPFLRSTPTARSRTGSTPAAPRIVTPAPSRSRTRGTPISTTPEVRP